MKDMENKRKIVARKQPFDIKYSGTKKGDKWILCIDNQDLYKHEIKSNKMEKEIVEAFFEPIYEEIKLEDLPKTTMKKYIEDWEKSPLTTIDYFFEKEYPNGVIILPDNE